MTPWEKSLGQKIEKYSFKLVTIDGKWKLTPPDDLHPHISIDTAILHIQKLYETQKDVQPKAPEILQQLKQLKEKV